ncbi:unnamed protein product [Mytilus coruscus]|uniref:G-protein coupled receptors family 1 profile domain-containing protein n=1 Tax=Mytilus coruscus TaxID=42192 RepID=A0A6J8DUX5_MYTCO|nr:unnamed protein product [Mytilus coruscus]
MNHSSIVHELYGNQSSTGQHINLNRTTTSQGIASMILNIYIGPILCAFGICGNIMNLIVLFKGRLTDSPYLYLKTLALTDMFALTLSLVHMTISGKSTMYVWQFFNAYVFFPLANFFMAASVWLTVGVTIDRFIYVKAPLFARGYCSRKRARVRIILILCFTLLVSVPRFYCYTVNGNGDIFSLTKSSFRASITYYRIYNITCIVIIHVAPLLILMFCNVYLICALRNAKSTREELHIRNNREKDWQRDQRRFTITLISIVLVSIIAIVPSTIVDFVQFFKTSFNTYRKLRLSSNLLLLCNLSMNFLLYCAFNKRFVRAMKTIFCKDKVRFTSMKRSRSPNSTINTYAVDN